MKSTFRYAEDFFLYLVLLKIQNALLALWLTTAIDTKDYFLTVFKGHITEVNVTTSCLFVSSIVYCYNPMQCLKILALTTNQFLVHNTFHYYNLKNMPYLDEFLMVICQTQEYILFAIPQKKFRYFCCINLNN